MTAISFDGLLAFDTGGRKLKSLAEGYSNAKLIRMKSLIVAVSFFVALAGECNSALGQADSKSSSAPASADKSAKDLTVDETEKLLKKNKTIIVLDVRTAKEYSAGHISGAKNIDFYDANFQKMLEELDKDQTYLVHCASGGRSARARDLMKKMQFRSIYHLKDGFKAWEKEGKPVER